MKSYDFGHKTLEQVAERVTLGATQGFEELTSDFLAASYAAKAMQESGFCDEESAEAHLEILAEAGAEFDAKQAAKLAVNLCE